MSLNAAAVRLLAEKGLTAIDIAEVMEAIEAKPRPLTGAERAKRCRDKKAAADDRNESNVTRVTHPLDKETPPTPPKEINPLPSGSNEPSGTPRARKGSQLPPDWKPILTDRTRAIVDGWPPGAFEAELRKFRNHAADKGRISKDWQAAFRNWIDKANEDGRLRRQSSIPGLQRPDPLRAALADAIAEEAAERECSGRDPPDYPGPFTAFPAH